MPTPLELLLDPVSLLVFAMYGGLLLAERLWPARELPTISGWYLRAAVSFFTYFFVSSYAPLLWDGHLEALRIFDLRDATPWIGATVGIFAYEALAYAYHRAMHAQNFLFRTLHQMHHSAERLDAAGAFYFSPLDMLGWSLVGSFGMVVIVGISPEAATRAILVLTFLGIFQHANLRTPRWLGYLVQRPESHAVHHQRGWHRNNYADLPIFDIAFGTFDNPADYPEATGFYDGASARVAEMLIFCDVSEAPVPKSAASASLAAATSSATRPIIAS